MAGAWELPPSPAEKAGPAPPPPPPGAAGSPDPVSAGAGGGLRGAIGGGHLPGRGPSAIIRAPRMRIGERLRYQSVGNRLAPAGELMEYNCWLECINPA